MFETYLLLLWRSVGPSSWYELIAIMKLESWKKTHLAH
jgi:hypothetical protein